MRFSVTIDPHLLEEAKKLSQTKTKKAVIEMALQEFIRNRKLKEIQDLAGSGLVDITLEELDIWRKGKDA